MMEDKEVGRLWHDANVRHGHWHSVNADEPIIQLICKLVEERQLQYVASGNSLESALRDFGIDPDSYK